MAEESNNSEDLADSYSLPPSSPHQNDLASQPSNLPGPSPPQLTSRLIPKRYERVDRNTFKKYWMSYGVTELQPPESDWNEEIQFRVLRDFELLDNLKVELVPGFLVVVILNVQFKEYRKIVGCCSKCDQPFNLSIFASGNSIFSFK